MNLKRSKIIVFFLGLLLSPLFANERYAEITCAVIKLDAYGVSESEASTLTDRLRDDMFSTKKFKIVEREKVDNILAEQGFQQTGCTSDKCLIQVGKLIAVNRIIGGSIGKIGQTFSVSVRMIDVESGQIIKIVNENYSGKIDNLLTEVIPKIVYKIADMTYPTFEYHQYGIEISGLWKDKNDRVISFKGDVAICISSKESSKGWIHQMVMKDINFRDGKWYALISVRNADNGALIKWLPIAFQIADDKLVITHLTKPEKHVKYSLVWKKIF
jgi:hypothetical protein